MWSKGAYTQNKQSITQIMFVYVIHTNLTWIKNTLFECLNFVFFFLQVKGHFEIWDFNRTTRQKHPSLGPSEKLSRACFSNLKTTDQLWQDQQKPIEKNGSAICSYSSARTPFKLSLIANAVSLLLLLGKIAGQ